MYKLTCKHVSETQYCKSCKSAKAIAFILPHKYTSRYVLMLYMGINEKEILDNTMAAIHRIKLDKNGFITEVEKSPAIKPFRYYDTQEVNGMRIPRSKEQIAQGIDYSNPRALDKYLAPIIHEMGKDFEGILKEVVCLFSNIPKNFLVDKIKY